MIQAFNRLFKKQAKENEKPPEISIKNVEKPLQKKSHLPPTHSGAPTVGMTTADVFTLRELVETYAKDIGFYTTLRAYRHSESRTKKEIGVDNHRMISRGSLRCLYRTKLLLHDERSHSYTQSWPGARWPWSGW